MLPIKASARSAVLDWSLVFLPLTDLVEQILTFPSSHTKNHFRGGTRVGKETPSIMNNIVDTSVNHLNEIINFLTLNRPSMCTSVLSL